MKSQQLAYKQDQGKNFQGECHLDVSCMVVRPGG